MNRLLLVPGLFCLLAFGSAYAVFSGAAGVEDPSAEFAATSAAPLAAGTPLPEIEAERMLDSLREAYRQRQQAWEESPHRLYSRAAPRPLPQVSIEFVLEPASSGSDRFVLATMLLHQAESTETVPAVVDPPTKQTRLFHDGRWLTDREWLENAIWLPGGA